MVEKKLGGVKSFLKSASEKKLCPSVCLTFFESADARDLGLTTLLHYYADKDTVTHMPIYEQTYTAIHTKSPTLSHTITHRHALLTSPIR